jgi:hypothetical protein
MRLLYFLIILMIIVDLSTNFLFKNVLTLQSLSNKIFLQFYIICLPYIHSFLPKCVELKLRLYLFKSSFITRKMVWNRQLNFGQIKISSFPIIFVYIKLFNISKYSKHIQMFIFILWWILLAHKNSV